MAIAPWSVKGIDTETREAAKTAARKAGVTLGAWLNRTILDAAAGKTRTDAGPNNGYAVPPASTDSAATRVMFETIEKMSARLEELEERLLQAPPTLAERLDRLSADLETARSGLDAANEPMERAIARLSERVQRLELGGLRQGEPPPRKRFGMGLGK